MAQRATDEAIPQDRRMEIFRVLVEAQDGRMTLLRSRQVVAQRFGITERQIRRIEKEGLDGNWPPL